MNAPLIDVGRLWARSACSVVINMGRHDNYSFNRRIDVLEGEWKSYTCLLAESLIARRWHWHSIISTNDYDDDDDDDDDDGGGGDDDDDDDDIDEFQY
jgi:hypothetical protein